MPIFFTRKWTKHKNILSPNTGAQSINTERASLMGQGQILNKPESCPIRFLF